MLVLRFDHQLYNVSWGNPPNNTGLTLNYMRRQTPLLDAKIC